jgi:hypothetical protein
MGENICNGYIQGRNSIPNIKDSYNSIGRKRTIKQKLNKIDNSKN